MSKPASFFDWEYGFRKKAHSISKKSSIKKINNPLGIPMKIYKDYLEKWREENL
jgi:hypothetical protein